MVRTTKQQDRAQKAFDCISSVRKDNDNYCQFAKKFPALVHNCGLAQAVAFFQSKKGTAYLDDLAKVMGKKDNEEIGDLSRTVDLLEYQHLTREAIESATWIKRYSEAILDKCTKNADPEMR
jgi:CRISPR-associated protein Cmr5